jgi:hypothetical protein
VKKEAQSVWKIKLILEGNLVHELGDVRSGKPGWGECQPSGILRIEFPFIGKIDNNNTPLYLILSGMEEYNFFVEAMRPIGKGITKIKGLWFLGKVPKEDRVIGFVVGDSCKSVNTIFGREYNGTRTVGWKKGIIGDKIYAELRRM